ncbi:putative ribosomally synthesized peptide with SipW-like signal peptide [Rhodococcus sp. LBL1]|nr:putative ribosomally synthesized peptide with SipW-like signal peptide [Rhodococcus sp. LBL1]MDH6681801.1 putative ribosomally synthesized peptide with SipW-like signal peptide [Rhodococcus sp. LBL2]
MSRDEILNSTPTVGARMRKALGGGRVRAALSLGIVLGLGSVGTLAAWSDTATATSNEFKTGSIDLKLGPEAGAADNYTFSAFGGSGLLPGSTVQAPLDVRNKGDVPFKYSMAAKATGNASVAGQIKLDVFAASNCSGPAIKTITMSASDQAMISDKGPVVALNGVDTICVRATVGNELYKAMQNQSINVVFTFTATSV